ncbi:MAG: hypothetical protein ACKV2V_30550 [Blastocatellia bacterium]
MKQECRIPDNLLMDHAEEIELIFRRAVRQALWRHKRLGQYIAASKNGKVVIIPPEEIPVGDDPEETRAG